MKEAARFNQVSAEKQMWLDPREYYRTSYLSVRWRLCCWQQNGRREGCRSVKPQD